MVRTIHFATCGPEAAVTVFDTDFLFVCLKISGFTSASYFILINFILFYFLPLQFVEAETVT